VPDISATFKNNYGQSRRWVVVDTGRDPNSPPTIFDGYLDAGQATASLAVYSSDGIYGNVTYQRSDGAPTVTSVTDGSEVRME
jgi:hypothetical protein